MGAKFILTDEARAKRVMEAVKDLECVEEVFVIGQPDGCTSVYELMQDDGKGEQAQIFLVFFFVATSYPVDMRSY